MEESEVVNTAMLADESEMKRESRSSDKEILREYEIRIEFLSGRGCLVSVGCKRIAFEDNQKAMEAINAYVANPYEESKKWNEIFNQ